MNLSIHYMYFQLYVHTLPFLMDLLTYYHHLTNHIIPGPQSFSYFIPPTALLIALLVPRTTLQRWANIAIFMPIVVIATLHAWRAMRGVDVISVDVLLWALYFLVLKDPWRDFALLKVREGAGSSASSSKAETDGVSDTRNGEEDEGRTNHSTGHHTQPSRTVEKIKYPHHLLPRLQWVLNLLTSIRQNNWHTNTSSHDRAQPPAPAFPNRKSFLLHILLATLRGYITLDLTSAYVARDAYFTDPDIPITAPLPSPFPAYIPPPTLRAAVIAAQSWALISQLFYAPTVLPVLLNTLNLLPSSASPHTWPPYFGPARAIFTNGVRGFWGSYWHQMMRVMCSAPGYAVADCLRLRRGGLGRYAVVTLIAFALSGVTHMGLVPPEPLGARVGVGRLRLYVAGFFWLQPLACLVEVAVGRVWAWLGLRSAGYVGMAVKGMWVLGWFSLCLPLLGEAGRQLGAWRCWLVPVSLFKFVMGEEAVMWSVLRGWV